MKKLLLVACFMLFNLNSLAQIVYEEGYFVKDNGNRVECLIKNIDWKNNPSSFEYKLTEAGDSKTADIKTVKEFGIKNISQYQRHTVKLDRSSSDMEEMSIKREAQFNVEQLFLKVLVEGQASLLGYEEGNLRRYFFELNNGKPKQLVYKKYKAYYTPTGENNFNNGVRENNLYKQQLFNNVNCNNTSSKAFEDIDYKKSQLVDHFVEYNKCESAAYKNFTKKQNRDLFNLRLRPGIKHASLSIHNRYAEDRDFGNRTSFRFGIEVEYILPFNKNKWGIFIEPTYQYFDGEAPNRLQTIEVQYQSIELPLGIRHYFFLDNNSTLFVDASVIIDLDGDSKIAYSEFSSLDINTRENLTFGAGYKYDKFSAELRYGTNREFLSDYTRWSSDYYSFSFILGYTLF